MALMTPTNITLVNRGNTVTASNTVAASTLAFSCTNNGVGITPVINYGQNVLLVAAIAIFTGGVTVSSITNGGGGIPTGWTFQGASTEPVSGVRVEMWTAPCLAFISAANSTINFSGAALASVAMSSYIQPYDYASVPLVNNGYYANASGTSTGVHTEFFTSASFTSGNLIIVSVVQNGGGPNSASSVTDSVGTSYSQVNSAFNGSGGGNVNVQVFAGLAGASSSAPLVTVNWPGTSDGSVHYYVSQWAGISAVVDQVATGGSVGGGINTTNLTTTFANDFIHAVVGWYNAQANPMGQTPGYCLGNMGTLGYEGGRVVTSTGTYATYWVNTNVGVNCVTSFKISPTYTPTAAPTPNIVTANGAATTGFFADVANTPQFGGGMIVTAYAVATTSGDTFAGSVGTLRSSVTPTVTSAAAVLMESGPENLAATMRTQLRMSAQRAWAAISFELVAGNSTYTLNANPQIRSSSLGQVNCDAHQLKSNTIAEAYKVDKFVQGGSAASLYLSAANLAGGQPGVTYTETISANGGFSPYTYTIISGAVPTGTTLNASTGVISGTPTTVGTYNFTVKAVDSAANTATNSFQIIIAVSASGGSFTFVS